jgi:hypothetical protein
VANHGVVYLSNLFKTASGMRCLACGCRTTVTAHQGETDEPPFQEYGIGGSLYPADKVSIAEPSRSVGH